MLSDDDDVRKLLTVITSGLMKYKFSPDEDDDEILPLISIPTGVRTPFAPVERLISSFEIGTARSDDKVLEHRLNNNNTKLWDSLPDLKIKTFASLVKKKTTKLVDENVLNSNADRELFSRLVIAATPRVINLKYIIG